MPLTAPPAGGHTHVPQATLDSLIPLVYEELRSVARRQLRREQAGHTLDTTAVIHEAYLRLSEQRRAPWGDRVHFLAVASLAMRRVLVDHARRRRAEKRGGTAVRVPLSDAMILVDLDARADELLALDQALDRLARLEPRLARVVECRFFSGLTEEETAEVLGVTARTVRRDWVKARGWLFAEVQRDG